MNNFGAAIVKVVVLAGGAAMGALLGRWCDELISTRLRDQSEYDKTRYAQGLAPLSVVPPNQYQGYTAQETYKNNHVQ